MRKEKAPYYSIVIPIQNEEDSIIPLFAKIVETMEAQEWDFEIVFVDDASTDGSFVLLEQIASLDSRVVVVQLRRNFGQTAALAAGFDYARGEVIVSMDGDFQHDPADLPLLIEKIHQGFDIVSGWRKQPVIRWSGSGSRSASSRRWRACTGRGGPRSPSGTRCAARGAPTTASAGRFGCSLT